MSARAGGGGRPWPFADPPNAAAYVARRIIDAGGAVLRVYHDDDGEWQFLDGLPVTAEDGAVVALGYMLDFDPGLADLADLPPGWVADRDGPDKPWVRAPHPMEEDEDGGDATDGG